MTSGAPRRRERASSPKDPSSGGGRRRDEEGPDAGTARRRDGASTPDVYLDVPKLEVDHIGLEVENLRARVSLQAEVLDLLKLNVGVDAELGRVALEIDGVSAEATLKVRLDEVAGIIDRVLDTIDRNPQILETVVRTARDAVQEVGSGVGDAASSVGQAAGDAVGEVAGQAGGAVGELTEQAGDAVGEVTSSVGDAVGEVADQAGDVAADATEEAGDTSAVSGDDPEASDDPTPARTAAAGRSRRSPRRSTG